jgi:flavin reductase (DIM6/NTAB) family NADH-FMN oxidoreductase RutF
MISIDPSKISTQERYKIATGSVIPRPIALVSTMSKDGKSNLAPFSFFTIAAYSPLVLVFFPLNYKTGTELKDTAKNILETKECVIHIATEELAEKINQTSGLYPFGENEFDIADLTPVPSHSVKPFRVKECPIHFECKLYTSLEIGEGVGGSKAIFVEVVKAHINENLIHDFKISAEKLAPVTRLAGMQWAKLGELFELQRPEV